MKKHVFVACLLSSLCSLCLCGESFGQGPEPQRRYDLHVVLHFADHRLLTEVFRDRVTRELHDGLQASFGDLVRVEVRREHPRLNEVLRDGLKSLDHWKERDGVKTHFVLIDYSGAHYEIEARQYDGEVGLPGPVVRRDRTSDRELVAKTAALMIEQDFGLLGSFDHWPAQGDANEDRPASLRLRGSALGVPLDRWIRKGDVFAVVQMPRGDAGPGRPVPGALLMVEAPPAAGGAGCTCRVFRRYEAPRDADGDGYRCVHLGTVSAPLQLRLLQALPNNASGPLLNPLTVQVRHNGFDKEDLTKIEKTTGSDDAINTGGDKGGVFNNVAFVTILVADAPRARIPVPLLDDAPISLAVNVAADANSLCQFHKADWERHVDAAWQVQNQLFKEINDLSASPDRRAEAMRKIEEAIQQSGDDYDRLSKERDAVTKECGAIDAPNALDRLTRLRDGRTELREFLAKLKKIDAEENDPKRKAWLAQAEQAKRLELDDPDKAIALYETMLNGSAPDESLKEQVAKHLEELRKRWEPKSPEHANARKFIYGVWPNLDDAGLKEKMDEARAAYIACKTAGDMTSLRKLFQGTVDQADRMKHELDRLRPDVNIDDEKPAKLIKEDSEGLSKLARDVKETLDANAGK